MEKFVVAFTGTSRHDAMTPFQKNTLKHLLIAYRVTELHHGDCVEADSYCHSITQHLNANRSMAIRIEIHPCNINNMRAYCEGADMVHPVKPPLVRNHDMVDVSDWLIACPRTNEEELRSGTWATIRYARKLKKHITIIWPLGGTTVENKPDAD